MKIFHLTVFILAIIGARAHIVRRGMGMSGGKMGMSGGTMGSANDGMSAMNDGMGSGMGGKGGGKSESSDVLTSSPTTTAPVTESPTTTPPTTTAPSGQPTEAGPCNVVGAIFTSTSTGTLTIDSTTYTITVTSISGGNLTSFTTDAFKHQRGSEFRLDFSPPLPDAIIVAKNWMGKIMPPCGDDCIFTFSEPISLYDPDSFPITAAVPIEEISANIWEVQINPPSVALNGGLQLTGSTSTVTISNDAGSTASNDLTVGVAACSATSTDTLATAWLR